MSTVYKYVLEKGSKKHYCPECNKKRFVRYIDTNTDEYLPFDYGRCDRDDKCKYHLNPYQDGYAKAVWKESNLMEFSYQKPKFKCTKLNQTIADKYFFIPKEVLKQTLEPNLYGQNIFIQNLLTEVPFPFEKGDIEKVISLYFLGTIDKGYRAGAVCFPFIDKSGNIRAVQVKQFDKTNHATDTDFLHAIIEKVHIQNRTPLSQWLKDYKQNERMVSCLFGEQILSKFPDNAIALVEAPKTAIYGTLYFGFPKGPEDLIWLAVYNKSSFTEEKLKILQGRKVYVFPDLSKDGGTFDEWKLKAKKINEKIPNIQFFFSDLLERLAPISDRIEGYDLADYLIKQDWRKFRKHTAIKNSPLISSKQNKVPEIKIESTIDLPEVEVLTPVCAKNFSKEQSINWNTDIEELENYFANIELPRQPINLDCSSIIKDCSLFIESHITMAKANNGNKFFLPYLNRLRELQQVLKPSQNIEK
jgi:hypothetical protein